MTTRDFTGGKHLYPEAVKYDPQGEEVTAGTNGRVKSH